MWDERESWKLENEWIRRREGGAVRLTGECVLEEQWMTDVCVSFGMKSLDISIYPQTEQGMFPHCLSSLLDLLFICTPTYKNPQTLTNIVDKQDRGTIQRIYNQ